MQATINYYSGFAAELSVAKYYESKGQPVIARRWRGKSGEIDLIAREGDQLVFIEVKSAATHEEALQYLRPAQVQRIRAAVAEYLATEPLGSLTEVRFDLALVDRQGRIHLCPNILAA